MMNVNSPHAHELLSAYIDGDLDYDERQKVESHLQQCEQCRRLFISLRQTVDLIRSLPVETPPPSLRHSVMEAIRKEAAAGGARVSPRQDRLNRLKHWMRPLTWAAAVLLLIGAGYIGSLISQGTRDSYVPLVARNISAPEAGITSDSSGVMPSVQPEIGESAFDKNSAGGAAGVAPTNVTDGSADVRLVDVSPGNKVIRRAHAELEAEDVIGAFHGVVRMVESRGGFVEDSTLSIDPASKDLSSGTRVGAGDRASVVARVPAETLEPFIEELDQLGTVVVASIFSEDVTAQYVDTDSRLRNLKAQEIRYLELLERADNVDEILRIENEIWRVRGNIETLQGQLNYWNEQVDLATASVDIVSAETDPFRPLSRGLGNRLAAAIHGALDAALSGVENIIIGAGAILPWAVLVVLIWLVWRRFATQRSKSEPEP